MPGSATLLSPNDIPEDLGKFGPTSEVTETVPPRGIDKLFLKPLVMLAVAPLGNTGSTDEVMLTVADLVCPRLATGADEMLVIKLGMLLTPVNWSMVVPPEIVVLMR